MNRFKTTCCYCGVGCGIEVIQDRQGRIHVEGDKDHPVNRGMLCSKGMNLHYTAQEKGDRLLYPEMRWNRNSPLQRVSWDQALDRSAAVFKSLIQRFGPDSVGFYVSGQCLTEEYYVVNKLIKGFIGSNNIDTNSRLCMSSAVVGYKLTLGEDSVPASYEDIELADCFLVTGANPAWCHPILWRRVEQAKANNPDIKIIVVDPRKTQSCSIADLHLQINPGTDIVLYNAIGRLLIEMEKVDYEFIAHHCNGFEQYREHVMKRSLKEAASICGVKAEDIRWAAEYIGRSNGFISMWAMGLNQSVIGVNKNVSLISLSLITGKIGKPGSGPFSLTGQPNAMGGREVGGLANLLPAHRDLLNPAHREEVEKFWGGTKIKDKPGFTATEMFDALADGRMKAIWIICTNPLVSLPDARKMEAALKNAKFVVVQDMSDKHECIPYADVVLPAATWAEKEGTMTNSERRISYLHKITEAPGEALPDTDILLRFARKMGFHGFDFSNCEEVFNEHAALTKGTNIDISALTYDHLKQHGTAQWPFTAAQPGTKRLFTDGKFYTPTGKANIHSVPDHNESEPTSLEFPLVLTTGRIRDQWHTMTRTGKVNKLNQHIPQPFLEIHPKDAEERGIADNDIVVIQGHRGETQVKAKVTKDIKRGVVFLPMHWGKTKGKDFSRANNLTSPLLDPKSKEPDFKFAAVQVTKYQKPKQRILVIGAGAAAYGFVKSFRERNKEDEILVFSKESQSFYNRVMLPDYIAGTQSWPQLLKLTEDEEAALGVRVLKGISITQIDRERKLLMDSEGREHRYDLLVLATGSRSAVPKDIPSQLEGFFTLRTKLDADRLMQHLQPQDHVVIVGGGLLGLELSSSLRELNFRASIIQRTSRLMSRQLDAVGASLLKEELIDRGIEIYYNDEIQTFIGREKITAVKLKSGHTLPCTAVVYATGTTPNIELAKACGLKVQRGVEVNDYLQTNDPDIFAIGEIAEHQQNLYGITAAAEEQAETLAAFLNGDLFSFYQGSLSMNILKIPGLDLCSLGVTELPDDSGEYEEVVFIDKATRYYKKCIIHRDKLIGAILIGDKTEFNEFRELIKNKIELSEKRLSLLRSGKKAEEVIGKLVCSCNNVGEGNIVKKIEEGVDDLKELCLCTGAGTGCGSCKSEVKNILERSLKLA
ncbi:MAG: molybdopterin-dependent oxidoreductase [Cytophagaceae bacterium]|jgi:ferredoxin-nitrate reductase|nr:molybdopterin-dependent oxidoreductase [Cytophagaceae bacterium]